MALWYGGLNIMIECRHLVPGISKDQLRFVNSSAGFPEDMERIEWDVGFETHLPFVGEGCSEDEEGLTVTELMRCALLERSRSGTCGPETEAFRVRDLVLEVELDSALQGRGHDDDETVSLALMAMVDEIRSHLRESTTVVIRRCTLALGLRFSKVLMGVQFGNLGHRCQWVDGVFVAANRNSPEEIGIHRTTTMERFIDLVEDPTVCGNFLDSKDTNPSPLMWVMPLLDSTFAWNHTMHLRFTQSAQKKKKKPSKVVVGEQGPSVIRSGMWTLQGWRLVTHPGFITFLHRDCSGMCTYIIGNLGAKIWAVMRPKRVLCPDSSE
ncbi:hypothetical protein J3R82DRAFT_2791 [Butyriboletus roseoflavus]|nr:hypothetical protein J3R82DRAFT_2791 [Butyriboletus roseoflavus]